MKNHFGTFNASEEALAREMWEFRTCQRPDGSYYGTGGQCRKGTETTKPEKEEKKGKGGGKGSGNGDKKSTPSPSKSVTDDNKKKTPQTPGKNLGNPSRV